jgi:UDP-N-acetylglucosamine pyrophosphorylase
VGFSYHVARKAIPHVSEESGGEVVHPKVPNGIKLEMFVFDAFARASNMHALAVSREAEFAPVKNAPGVGVPDSPVTARKAVAALHAQWIKAAGANITGETSGGGEEGQLQRCRVRAWRVPGVISALTSLVSCFSRVCFGCGHVCVFAISVHM